MYIRRYKKTDYPDILKIYALSKLDELRFENKEFILQPLDKDPKRLSEFNESDIYVYQEQKIVGFIGLFGSEIRMLFVHPTARGKGIGKLLLEFLLSKISGEMSLNIVRSNFPAKNLYSAYGFQIIDEYKTSYNGISVLANKMLRTEAK